MNIPNNFGIAFSLTVLAGLTTAIGGAIAFVTKKDNLKVLSVGLGFSAGVMIFLSFVDTFEYIKRHDGELIRKMENEQ